MTTDKNGKEITENIPSILQFIDSARSIVCSLSKFDNNLSEEIHQIKCKHRRYDKKCET